MYLEDTGMENRVGMIQTDCTSAGIHGSLLQAVLVEKRFEHVTRMKTLLLQSFLNHSDVPPRA